MWCLETIIALNEKAQRDYDEKKRQETQEKPEVKVVKVA